MPDTYTVDEVSKKERGIALFRFIKELNKLKQKVILNVSDYPKYIPIRSLPDDPENIQVSYRDHTVEDDVENESSVLLAVHKAEFHSCPKPDDCLEEWLETGWDDFRKPCRIKLSISQSTENFDNLEESDTVEYFADDANRVALYQEWQEKRNAWAKKQKLYKQTNELFTELYNIAITLEREAETMEFIVADGFIRDRKNPEIDHPLLTRRVKIRHDAEENTIYIEDADVESELYTVMFQMMSDVNLNSINHLNDELNQNDYHPLDRNELPTVFKIFVHQLSSDSQYSEDDISEISQKKDRIILYHNPCYILRKRMDGTLKAIEQIIENVEQTGEIPNPIADIVKGGKIDIPEEHGEFSIEEQLAAVGGESVDILLSKEANKEQLEIARRLEQYNAVLVQGPPGTGKTHTIANLMGHFLAQGKSILVTSYTQKALTVLKEKIVPGLQDLCVSVLDDSNVDMEKSIDGITNYMSSHTSFELKKEMDLLGLERKQIIQDLAATRKKMFTIINQECNCIVYNGKSISPSAAALFVQQNINTLSYIPGDVRLYEPLPLSFSELEELYHSNEIISSQDETELASDIPDPMKILSPEEFEQECVTLNTAQNELELISSRQGWKINFVLEEKKITIWGASGQLQMKLPEHDAVINLRQYISSLGQIEPWMEHCATDGKKGGAYRQLWETMIQQIEKTCERSEALLSEKFGKEVKIQTSDPELHSAIEQLREKYMKKGKIGKFDLFLNRGLETALNSVLINGQKPQTVEDCDLVLHMFETQSIRDKCAAYWNDLIAKYDVPMFGELDTLMPEQVAANYIPDIKRYLDWYANEYSELESCVRAVGLNSKDVFLRNPQDTDILATQKILSTVLNILPVFCDIFDRVQKIMDSATKLRTNQKLIDEGKCAASVLCRMLADACQNNNIEVYRNSYKQLQIIYGKYEAQHKRDKYLKQLMPIAPQWAEAIRTRSGIHGKGTVPSNIEDAWRWKQYNGIIDEIISESFSDLQKKSLSLSKEYRKITAKFAEKSAWYHLLSRTEHDIDIKQSLVGWKLTVKKIGKGTGKNAPRLRAEARSLMVKCQEAVPGWIMPINKALESLNPKQNKFDVVIIDEASQSDISSLAILYMGRKLVIVGDDKQVSPMGIGTQIDKMNTLKEMYIADKIPNAHLFDSKTSIYDLASTTFQPLMLREHFRCVPEIIGFSNWLSYDFKIKPLRDNSNSKLLPAVISYRVVDGYRKTNKTNPAEAKTIVALMRACIEQPEYAGKTFGVISLLGDEQVRVIQDEIFKNIDAGICNERRILCGNASNFQGDERDVIFLSMVDCANGNGPVAKQGFGVDDAYRKRYNVAASRARDQLWIIHSFDPANDLKAGDIRKMLLDYASNPESVNMTNMVIDAKAESPFESDVAKYLTMRGYHLVQQWKVGAYRLDMVAVCGKDKVAIECDGERFHSGEAKIREDMERQTILERLGWRFIRIRGSEYYRNPNQTMDRVIDELIAFGIEPEESEEHRENGKCDTDLLQRVKVRSNEFLRPIETDEESAMETIAAALNPREYSMEDLGHQKEQLNLIHAKQTETINNSIRNQKNEDTNNNYQFVQLTLMGMDKTK